MRPSEICALRWGSIDWIGNTIQVSAAKVVGVIKTTKTRAGTRTIELTSDALAALTSQKRFTFMRGEYVFEDPKLGEPWSGAESIRKKAWLYTLRRSGVRYRHLYQTRHTFATANISRGCNLFWLATQMGHKGPEMLFRHYGSYLAEYPAPPNVWKGPPRKRWPFLFVHVHVVYRYQTGWIFFPISPLNWPLAKKSGASPRRLYHQVAIPVLAGLTAAHRHVVAQY